LPDREQHRIVAGVVKESNYTTWREVILLLAGVLFEQGSAKVDAFVAAMLKPSLQNLPIQKTAMVVGLLGSVFRELRTMRYRPQNRHYDRLLREVIELVNSDRARSIPIEYRIEVADALGQAGDPRIELHDQKFWIPIAERTRSAQPARRTHSNGIYRVHIAKYPVTVEEYERFMDDRGHSNKAWWSAGGFERWTVPAGWNDQRQFRNRPVVGVSWFEAMAYAKWVGCRLPTEQEWERAALGTTGHQYPWGDAPPNKSRLNCDRYIGHPSPIGVYPEGATANGVHDMAGNVWEWCNSDYVLGDRNDEGPEFLSSMDREIRVIRGGAWDTSPERTSCTYRGADRRDNRSGSIGFRLVRDADPGQ
jgi:hypothetical protein